MLSLSSFKILFPLIFKTAATDLRSLATEGLEYFPFKGISPDISLLD